MRLVAFLVALVLLAAAPAVESVPTTIPVQVVLVVPSGYAAPYTTEQAATVVNRWTGEVNSWIQGQVGLVFDYTFTVWNAPFTLADVGAPLDACGSPTSISTLWTIASLANQAGIVHFDSNTTVHEASVGRLWFVLVGGGGWAGGDYAGGKHDLGKMLVGDWGLQFDAIGQRSPCDPYSSAGSGAYGHEIMHSMDVDSHNPTIFTGYPMSAQQKRDLVNHNKAFLRAP